MEGSFRDRGLTTAVATGYVIWNQGALTIKDTSPLQTSKVTSGNNTGNGGIYCDDGSTLTPED